MRNAIVTQRESKTEHGGLMDSLEQEYVDFFQGMDFHLFPISCFTGHVSDFADALQWDALILSGGGLLSTDAYDFRAEGYSQCNRNRVEAALLNLALQNDIPVIGICRGMQVINAFFGGKTTQSEKQKELRPIKQNHAVSVVETDKEFLVNHYHGDLVLPETLGEGISPLIFDEETGGVEALQHERYRIFAVQWHPERSDSSAEAKSWFTEKVKKLFAGKRP